MDAKALLEAQAGLAFEELLAAIEGVDQGLAWAVPALKEGEYLHTDGSILSLVQHIACGKRMYASTGFRGGEVRWRDCADLYEAIGSDWQKTIEDLRDAHRYWLDSWAGLTSEDLESTRQHFRGRETPVWKLLTIVVHHDEYHAGQIEIAKVTLSPSNRPPASTADDIRTHCRDLPNW